MDINADRNGGTGMSWEHCTQKPKTTIHFLSHVLQTPYARKLPKECDGERKANTEHSELSLWVNYTLSVLRDPARCTSVDT